MKRSLKGGKRRAVSVSVVKADARKTQKQRLCANTLCRNNNFKFSNRNYTLCHIHPIFRLKIWVIGYPAQPFPVSAPVLYKQANSTVMVISVGYSG